MQFDHHKYNINSTQIPDFIPIHNRILFIIDDPFCVIFITAIIYWAIAMRPYGKYCLIDCIMSKNMAAITFNFTDFP
jgi:hypothetical protein